MNANETDKKFSEWHKTEREKIDWHPTIDETKCIGCGLCATTCGRAVYKFDYENRKSKVANPNNCLVGCQTCANLCPAQAISFTKERETTRQKAQKIVKEFKILQKVKEELNEKKETLQFNGESK